RRRRQSQWRHGDRRRRRRPERAPESLAKDQGADEAPKCPVEAKEPGLGKGVPKPPGQTGHGFPAPRSRGRPQVVPLRRIRVSPLRSRRPCRPWDFLPKRLKNGRSWTDSAVCCAALLVRPPGKTGGSCGEIGGGRLWHGHLARELLPGHGLEARATTRF